MLGDVLLFHGNYSVSSLNRLSEEKYNYVKLKACTFRIFAVSSLMKLQRRSRHW